MATRKKKKAATPVKKATKKTPVKANPTASAAPRKPPAKKVKRAAPRSSGKPHVSPEERFRMIQTAAYYIAEKDGFSGDPSSYWGQAEQKIFELLGD